MSVDNSVTGNVDTNITFKVLDNFQTDGFIMVWFIEIKFCLSLCLTEILFNNF